MTKIPECPACGLVMEPCIFDCFKCPFCGLIADSEEIEDADGNR